MPSRSNPVPAFTPSLGLPRPSRSHLCTGSRSPLPSSCPPVVPRRVRCAPAPPTHPLVSRMCDRTPRDDDAECESGGGRGNLGDDSDDPDAPPKLTVDWRSFRARLIGNEAASSDADGAAGGRGGASAAEGRMGVVEGAAGVWSQRRGAGERMERAGSWVHVVTHAESGCLLVARPDAFVGSGGADYFAETVVFVVHHDEKGTLGLILNKPIARSIAAVPTDTSTPAGEAFHMAKAEVFHSTPLYNGGPMSLDSMLVLHGLPGLPDGQEVIDGVYSGGLLSAIGAVRDGGLEAWRCKFFAGYAGWAPGQLQDEIDNGTWLLAACSSDYVIADLPGKDTKTMWSDLWEELKRGQE